MNATDNPIGAHRRWWLLSIGQVLWLVLLLGMFFSPQRQSLINTDGDGFWHLQTGTWMMEHREVIRSDPFSHTRFGERLITHDWLSEILYAALWKTFGWSGIALAAAALIATTLWILHRQLLSEGNDILLSTALVLLAAMACSVHWLARPLLATHLMVAWYVWQLRAFDRGRLAFGPLLWRLVPLMVLWANLHGAFPSGLVLIGLYLAGNAFGWITSSEPQKPALRKKTCQLAIVWVSCLAATLVNPNGWRLDAHIVAFLRSPLLNAITPEFSSPDFHSTGLRGFVGLLLLLGFVFIVRRPRLQLTDVLLIGGWGWLSLRTARNVPVFAIVVVPILAEHLNAWLDRVLHSGRWPAYRRLSNDLGMMRAAAGGRAVVGLVVVAAVLFLAQPSLVGGRPLVQTGIDPERFPVEAASFVREHPDSVHGEMLNDYDWGGYLMLALPDRRVFVDGRNDFYGEPLIREYLQATNLQPEWEGILGKYHVGWVILAPDHPLNSYLALRSDWELVHEDPIARVYAKRH